MGIQIASQYIKINKHNVYQPYYLVVLICLFTFLGCDSSTDPEPLRGEVIGLVQPVDQWSNPVRDSSVIADIEVQLEGTSYAAFTDDSGRFVLDNVEAGTYTITAEKSEYGTNKLPFYQFVGGGQDFIQQGEPIEIGQIPDYDIAIDSVFIDPGNNLVCEGSIAATIPENSIATVVTYVSDSPDISATDPSSYLSMNTSNSFPGVTRFSGVFDLSNFDAGQELYFKSYPIAKATLFYLDPTAETNKLVFSSLGESTEEVSFTIPQEKNRAVDKESSGNSFNIVFHTDNNNPEVKRIELPFDPSSAELIEIREKIRSYSEKMEELETL